MKYFSEVINILFGAFTFHKTIIAFNCEPPDLLIHQNRGLGCNRYQNRLSMYTFPAGTFPTLNSFFLLFEQLNLSPPVTTTVPSEGAPITFVEILGVLACLSVFVCFFSLLWNPFDDFCVVELLIFVLCG